MPGDPDESVEERLEVGEYTWELFWARLLASFFFCVLPHSTRLRRSMSCLSLSHPMYHMYCKNKRGCSALFKLTKPTRY